MTAKLDDQARWSLIENYFLGFDNLVDSQLGVIEAHPHEMPRGVGEVDSPD